MPVLLYGEWDSLLAFFGQFSDSLHAAFMWSSVGLRTVFGQSSASLQAVFGWSLGILWASWAVFELFLSGLQTIFGDL